MSIKSLGPSLLAAEVLLPIDQAASYTEKIGEWGRKLGLTFYPTSHLVNPEHVLFSGPDHNRQPEDHLLCRSHARFP